VSTQCSTLLSPDKLGFPYTDVGEGWLIFDVPEADQGFHPAEDRDGARSGTPSISYYCDDIEKTMADLRSRGVEFTGPIEDHGYGLVSFFKVPGDFAVQLYQPRYVKNPRPTSPVIESAPPAAAPEAAPPKAKPRAVKAPAAKPKPVKKPAVKKAIKRVAAKSAAKPTKKAKKRR
jgi:hypothetical protein